MDRFSGFLKLIPLPVLPTALETVELIFNHLFRYYGIPGDIVRDRGPQFTSRIRKSFMEELEKTVSLTSGIHPQSDGQTERIIQEIGTYLRTYRAHNQTDRLKYLPWVEYTQNSRKHSATTLSSFQCVLGLPTISVHLEPKSYSSLSKINSIVKVWEVWFRGRSHTT